MGCIFVDGFMSVTLLHIMELFNIVIIMSGLFEITWVLCGERSQFTKPVCL